MSPTPNRRRLLRLRMLVREGLDEEPVHLVEDAAVLEVVAGALGHEALVQLGAHAPTHLVHHGLGRDAGFAHRAAILA
jgi:hypothetical protein